MKVYIDELPTESCNGCPYCKGVLVDAGRNKLFFCKANKGKRINNLEKAFNKCTVKNEFQSLADYTKQVRKEVCEEVKEKVLKHFNVKSEEEYEKSLSLLDALFTADVVFEILDQIQGEQ